MKTGKIFSLFVFLPVMMALVMGCGQRPPEQVWKIGIGVETVPHSSPVWIAENKGYFQIEGLQVGIREFESGRTALRTMLNNEGIDIVTAAQTPVISNSFDRNDYAIIGGMVHSDSDLKMLARTDRGIRTPSDLKGKTIGITSGSSGHFFLGLFLSYYHLKISDVKTIDIEPTRLSQSLIEGQTDAIATWEPYIYQTRKVLGEKALLLSSRDLYREDFYFISRKEFISKNPEALKRFLKAIEKGEEFILKNKKEAIEIVAQRLKMDGEILSAMWNDLQFRLFLEQSILTSLEDEARWAMRNKLTRATKMPNYLDFIYTDALKAVKPEAVKIPGK